MSPESKNIKEAIKTLEAMIKGWDDPAVPVAHAVLGVEKLECWEEEISSSSNESEEE